MPPMTHRERILSVYRGETPDVVPFMLDLSHWFYHKHGMPWDLSRVYEQPEVELIEYHKKMGVGFYLPNLASFIDVKYGEDVCATVTKSQDGLEITWQFDTPLGCISRTRRWNEQTYAWGIREWGIATERDLNVLAYALGSRVYTPRWNRYRAWVECVGDAGVVYAVFAYSGMGHLLNSWMGIENTVYAAADRPEGLCEVIDRINANNLECMDLLAHSPAEVVLVGDNFSSDIQSPDFFDTWSKPYYAELIRRLHAGGKHVAVHIDGRLTGLLDVFGRLGADCADAVTPSTGGGLTPEQCRQEAGTKLILSSGVPPNLWLPDVPLDDFKRAVMQWLDLKKYGPRLIANAGDQVPPNADEDRIQIMRDMVEGHGRY
ncbi:MAG: uroporphyrinogen decarboxylase family protein [Candidatus Hydrogenedentales bacterium]